MNILLYPVIIPLIIGILWLIIPGLRRIKEWGSFFSMVITFIISFFIFLSKPLQWTVAGKDVLVLDGLSGFILLAANLFGVLIVLYSFTYMKEERELSSYYSYILLSMALSSGAILSNNMVLFLMMWGMLGITLYLLINLSKTDGASQTAKKTFIIVGGSDACILMGIGIIWTLTTSSWMHEVKLGLTTGPAIGAFILLAIGAFAKAGCMPFHTWIPDTAEHAHPTVNAFLPASLDKLLGIYLLARMVLNLFVINDGVRIFLMVSGAITIIAAVMMALIQHNIFRLLGYHAVSQVGYMILGLGTGTPIGIAGGLFHMLNNSIYKSCLFLCGGSVKYRKRTAELDKMGGLFKVMPITFVTFLIASLAISGVPPLNGFFSKWMIYQGVLGIMDGGRPLFSGIALFCLICALFGSALTLASFMKILFSAFLGEKKEKDVKKDVPPFMWIPTAILALLCLVFGIWAYGVPMGKLILPAFYEEINYPGFWMPGVATIMILVGLALGGIIYYIGNLKNVRVDKPFTGGEILEKGVEVKGVEFYNSVQEIGILKRLYEKAEQRLFDIYDLFRKTIYYIIEMVRSMHSGLLPTYLSWCLLGLAILMFVLVR